MIRSVLLISVVCVLAGCGGEPLGEVRGHVSIGGQPVRQGSVVFENLDNGISVNAPLDDSGHFEVRTFDRVGLPVGTYQVAVSTRGFREEHEAIAVDPESQGAAGMPIPEKYHLPATSGLSFDVQSGSNECILKLDAN